MHSDVSIAIRYVPIYFSLEGINMKTNEIGLCITAKCDIIKDVKGWLQIGIVTKKY
jgi:hypothetical protein